MRGRPVGRGIAGGVALWAALAFAAAHAQAQPQPPKEFAQAYQAGKDAYNLGEFENARVALERAARIVPDAPGPYRYLAATAAAQERWERCLDHAVDYVRLADASSRYLVSVRELHARCRQALGRPRFVGELTATTGALAIVSNVDATSIKVNQLSYGATPLAPRVLAPGEVVVEASAAGHLPDMRRVTVYPGLVADVRFELTADPDYRAAPTIPVVAAPTNAIPDIGWIEFRTGVEDFALFVDGERVALEEDGRWQGPSGMHDVRIEAPGYETWERRVRVAKGQSRTVDVAFTLASAREKGRLTGWIAFGVAAAFTGAGVAFDVLEADAREEAQDIFDTETRRPAAGDSSALPLRTRAEMNDAADRARRNATISGVAYGLAAVSLGVSLYFLVENRDDSRRGAPAALAVVPLSGPDGGAPRGAAAVWQGEFHW